MQYIFAAIDIFDETTCTAFVGEDFIFPGTLIRQADMHAIVQE